MANDSVKSGSNPQTFAKLHERYELSDEMWDAIMRLQEAIEKETR